MLMTLLVTDDRSQSQHWTFFFENPCLLITADWAKATVVYLSPYCRLPSFAHDPQREMTQGVWEGKCKVQQWDRYD